FAEKFQGLCFQHARRSIKRKTSHCLLTSLTLGKECNGDGTHQNDISALPFSHQGDIIPSYDC
ncbi:unnamed protein product, partial [Larinioides sclopetarius]